MTHEEFTQTNGFRQWCLPFLSQLPKNKIDPPLRITYPKEAQNRVRWQWYNYLRFVAEGLYRISTKKNHLDASKFILEIRRKTPTTQLEGSIIKTIPEPEKVPLEEMFKTPEEVEKFKELIKEEEAKEEKRFTFDDLGSPPRQSLEDHLEKEE